MSANVPSFASLLLSLDVRVEEDNAHHQTIADINANKVSITTMAETLGWEHPDTLDQLNALVDLYLKAHCSEYAELLCHRLRLAFKRTYAPDNLIHANVSINMGIALNQQMKFREGADQFNAALNLFDSLLLAPHNIRRSAPLSGLGTSLYETQAYSQADSVLTLLLEIYIENYGQSHKDTLDTVNRLALCKEKGGKMIEAIALCEEYLTICINALGEADSITQTATASLARLKQSVKAFREAESMYLTAIDFCTKGRGSQHLQTLSLQESLGGLYIQTERYVEAEATLQYVLKSYKEVAGKESVEAGNVLQTLGELHMLLFDPPKARDYFEQAYKIREAYYKGPHQSSLRSLYSIGQSYHLQCRYKHQLSVYHSSLAEATRLFLEVVEKARVLLGATSTFFIEVSVYVGQFFLSYEMYAEGRKVYETLYRVIRIADDSSSRAASKSDAIILSPLERVDVLLQYGQCIEREKFFREACEIYIEARDMMKAMQERKVKEGWKDKAEEKDWHMKEEEVGEHLIFAKRMRDL